jgi:hypothetical protein
MIGILEPVQQLARGWTTGVGVLIPVGSRIFSSPHCPNWLWCFYTITTQRIWLYMDDLYSDTALILTAVAMILCMDLSASLHVCGVF